MSAGHRSKAVSGGEQETGQEEEYQGVPTLSWETEHM